MTYYNLYYKNVKLNNRPITEEEKLNVIKSKEIYKKNSINNHLEKINTSEIKFVKTIVI